MADGFVFLPHGGFRYEDEEYRPITREPKPNSRHLWKRYPHLFYSTEDGFIESIHPQIVSVHHVDDYGLSICIGAEEADEWQFAKDDSPNPIIVHPAYKDGHLYGQRLTYGTKAAMVKGHTQYLPDVKRALFAIRPEYLQLVENLEICYTFINEIPLTKLMYPNLHVVTLMGCKLRRLPYALCQMNNLTRLNVSFNPLLTEIPYHFMLHCAPTLEEFDLSHTGLTGLWVPTQHNCEGINMRETPMRVLAELEEKLYLRFDWDIRDNEIESDGVNKGIVRIISKKCKAPVVDAATAIIGLLRRRHINSPISTLSPDVARMIARFVLQTKGCAIWFPLAMQHIPCPELVIDDINTFNKRFGGQPLSQDTVSTTVRDWLIADVLKTTLVATEIETATETVTKRQKKE